MSRHPFRAQEDGVSVVVGGILILGLLVATLVTIEVDYVPIWQKDREAAHMRLVEAQLAALKSEVDRQIDNRTSVPIANPVSLAATSTNIFDRNTPPGVFQFVPGNRLVALSAPKLLVQAENGTSHIGLSETWTGISGAVNVENVAATYSLRLRLTSLNQNHAGDAVTITATDKNNAFAGDLRLLVSTAGANDWRINIRTRDATSTVLVDNALFFANDQSQAPYWVDALRSDYRFDKVLASALAPIRLTFAVANVDSGASNLDITADYAATYLQSGTQVVVGSSGVERTDYLATYLGGLLDYRATNNRFPSQEFRIEHGGLLLAQADGATFRVNPGFHASLAGSTTVVTITVPTLTGAQASFQGAGTAVAYTNTVSTGRLTGQANRLVYRVDTEHPSLWTTLWNDELAALAGYASPTNYETAVTATTATLTLHGLNADPNQYDLYLTFRQANIEVDVKG
ncbi:MAG: hypothetical protein HYT80_01315 [Euryarchaeota archaeon]|nr:hypothetical protein [Euryarchaeota archaeon]